MILQQGVLRVRRRFLLKQELNVLFLETFQRSGFWFFSPEAKISYAFICLEPSFGAVFKN